LPISIAPAPEVVTGFGDAVALVVLLAAFDEVEALDELTEVVVLFAGLTDEEDEIDALDVVEVMVLLAGLVEVRIVVDGATVWGVEVDVEVVMGLDVYGKSLVGRMDSKSGDEMGRGGGRSVRWWWRFGPMRQRQQQLRLGTRDAC
jgi:hypothetical protein